MCKLPGTIPTKIIIVCVLLLLVKLRYRCSAEEYELLEAAGTRADLKIVVHNIVQVGESQSGCDVTTIGNWWLNDWEEQIRILCLYTAT